MECRRKKQGRRAWPGDSYEWETRAWGAPSGSVNDPEGYVDGAQPNCADIEMMGGGVRPLGGEKNERGLAPGEFCRVEKN